MPIPDQPIFSAYLLEVIQQATIHARNLGLSKQSFEQISDLMDAIHVIPELLDKWERCDPPLLFGYLEIYDKKWSYKDNHPNQICGLKVMDQIQARFAEKVVTLSVLLSFTINLALNLQIRTEEPAH